MIKVSEIKKSFGELQVLKGISLQIRPAEIVTIVGASGAGKTTLLQIIGTLMKADSGTLQIDNMVVTKLKEKDMAKFRNQKIGFVFQFHNLLPEFTALENVCIPAFIAGAPRSVSEDRAAKLLQDLNLGDRLHHKPAELSGGEQQRVAVARALINKPSMILADEPSGNLDTKNKEELHSLFFKLRDNYNQTIVIVTHDQKLAAMADRTLKIHDGIID
jgi:lipoprotein-releasing system ATP-binding protein